MLVGCSDVSDAELDSKSPNRVPGAIANGGDGGSGGAPLGGDTRKAPSNAPIISVPPPQPSASPSGRGPGNSSKAQSGESRVDAVTRLKRESLNSLAAAEAFALCGVMEFEKGLTLLPHKGKASKKAPFSYEDLDSALQSQRAYVASFAEKGRTEIEAWPVGDNSDKQILKWLQLGRDKASELRVTSTTFYNGLGKYNVGVSMAGKKLTLEGKLKKVDAKLAKAKNPSEKYTKLMDAKATLVSQIDPFRPFFSDDPSQANQNIKLIEDCKALHPNVPVVPPVFP